MRYEDTTGKILQNSIKPAGGTVQHLASHRGGGYSAATSAHRRPTDSHSAASPTGFRQAAWPIVVRVRWRRMQGTPKPHQISGLSRNRTLKQVNKETLRGPDGRAGRAHLMCQHVNVKRHSHTQLAV